MFYSLLEFLKVDLADDDSEDSANQEPAAKRSKRNRRSVLDQSTKSIDTSVDQDLSTSTRTRQKNKQNAQQQLLAEQQRVEQRVQQEQMKLKQRELLQKEQEEKRQQQVRASNEDISNLRTNPNISMRELFPGEEELGLHVNLPFVSSNDTNLFNLTDYNG